MELSRPVVVQHHGHLTFTLDFQGQIPKMLYLRNGMADWHGTKGMWVDRMLHPLCDFQCSTHPWPWPWIFKVKFWKSCILGIGWSIDMELKGCESIECWTHIVTFNVHLTHDLDLGFSRSNFENALDQEWVGQLTWNERDRMLHRLSDFQLWPQPWPWPWIFKIKFWKSRISGMGWPIDMEWKGCESKECWTHVETLNLTLDFHGQILKKSYLMNGMADSHCTKEMWVDRMLDPCFDFQCSAIPWPWPWIFKVKFWKSCISGMGWPIEMERKRCELIEC